MSNPGEKVYIEAEVWKSAEDPAFVRLLLPNHCEYRFNEANQPVIIVRRSILKEWEAARRERGGV